MRFFCILVAMGIFAAAPASAEYYKYVDENGVMHFTDNLLEVPEKQREKLERFKEVRTAPPAAIKEADAADAADAEPVRDRNKQEKAPPEKPGPADDNATLSRLRELNQEKAILDTEYEYLVGKKHSLREERKKVAENPDNKEAVREYEARLNALNDEIRAFDQRRQVYQEKVKAFNASQ